MSGDGGMPGGMPGGDEDEKPEQSADDGKPKQSDEEFVADVGMSYADNLSKTGEPMTAAALTAVEKAPEIMAKVVSFTKRKKERSKKILRELINA